MGRDVGVVEMSTSRLLDALPRHAVAREGAAHLRRARRAGGISTTRRLGHGLERLHAQLARVGLASRRHGNGNSARDRGISSK